MSLFSSLTHLPWLIAGLGFAELPWYGNLLIALWLWCFGANVGSFMNVVVFRTPLGLSVVTPRSRCPKCETSIAWYDNVPMLSWLWLRAQCRHCGVSISSRYPTVEATVAILFVALALLGPMNYGDNLPERFAAPLRAQEMWSLGRMYAFHLMLLCTLICGALVRYDRQRVPLRLFFPAIAVGIAGPLVWPALRPIPLLATPAPELYGWLGLLDAIAGLAVGGSLSLVHAFARRTGSIGALPEVFAGAVTGLFLGWQAAAVLMVVVEAAHLNLGWLLRHKRPPWLGILMLASAGYIVLWRSIDHAAPWLVEQANIATFAVAFVAMAFVSWLSVQRTAGVELDLNQVEDQKRGPRMSDGQQPDANDLLNSHSYRLAERDTEFLSRPELRPVRLQLELLKPEMFLSEQGVHSTIVAFGGTQIVERAEAEQQLQLARESLRESPADQGLQRLVSRAERVLAKSKYYDAAREFGRIVSSTCQLDGDCDYVIVTGGGPGIMEAANRGAHDVGAKSIGFNITLPDEQAPNCYITPELCFQFHYFAIRKMHFLFRAKALVVFPGGFGTLDELFDALTLRQTNRMQEIPIILYGKEYWDRVVNFQFLADEGTIRDRHLELIHYAETPQEAWDLIADFHQIPAPRRGDP